MAARFFLNCITRPGTLCVQVAHDQQSAEEIFRIVHRLLANLPDYVQQGSADDVARQRAADRVSAHGFGVSGGDGERECGPRD